MGNFFSSENDLDNKTYSVKNIEELKSDLGKIIFKNNENQEPFDDSELNLNKKNFSNFSNVSEGSLVDYLKNIQENLFSNYNQDSWLEKQLDTELLDNNLLNIEFNSILPINYYNYNYLVDLINTDSDEELDEQDKKIVELHYGKSRHIFKDNKLIGKPLYGKVPLENVYVGNELKLGFYSNFKDDIELSNVLNLEWYLMVLKNGEVYVIFDNYYFSGIENDNILEYDDSLINLLVNANSSYKNNNLREFESYINQFNKYIDKLESDDDTEKFMIVKLGDTFIGNLLKLEDFCNNINFEL